MLKIENCLLGFADKIILKIGCFLHFNRKCLVLLELYIHQS